MEELHRIWAAYANAYTQERKNGYHAYEVRSMGVKDAVAARFESICRERKMTINELASRSGVTPSSVYSMMDPSRRNISIVLIKKLCDGLDLTLNQFFDGPEFDGLEQEIR
jgi:DNA-binding Xre family transcriptional regulator